MVKISCKKNHQGPKQWGKPFHLQQSPERMKIKKKKIKKTTKSVLKNSEPERTQLIRTFISQAFFFCALFKCHCEF